LRRVNSFCRLRLWIAVAVLMLVPRTEHDADRPSWQCRVCDQPWPCANAKIDLVEQYHRSRMMLTLFMSSCMAEAIDDLRWGSGSPAGLYDRFLGWVRPASVPKIDGGL
jgi:hypothetical protein